jgi:predicted MFS family arabinose efflux permease
MAAAYCPYAFIGEVTHTSGSELTLVLTAYGIGAVIGSLASGRFTDNAGPTRTLTITYLAMPIALLITATGGPPLVTFLAVAGWGATSWAQTPPQQHRLLSHNPNNATMVIGLNASALYLGVAVGTTLGSLLLTTSTHVIVSAATALAICAAVLTSRPAIAYEKHCAGTIK